MTMLTITKNLEPRLLEIFHHLHSYPEISWEETNTTAYIKGLLEEAGCKTQTFSDCTGVVTEIGEGLPVVGIRSDLDALWQEVDGCFQANHSCGHDAHMTMGMGALYALLKRGNLPAGRVRFIFQPAEEKGLGALKMIEKGVLDDVSYLFGVHLRPMKELRVGQASPSIEHGASRFLSGQILGEDSHGAWPHMGPNAIEVGAALVHMLGSLHMNPMTPWSAKMTRLQAGGSSSNIIPGRASFSLDLRAQTNEAMAALYDKVLNSVSAVSSNFGVKIETRLCANIVAAQTDLQARNLMAGAITRVLGSEKLHDPVVTPGGEDFHHYCVTLPQIKGTMLGLGCDLSPGLHHPQMTFDKGSIASGAAILAEAAIGALELCGR